AVSALCRESLRVADSEQVVCRGERSIVTSSGPLTDELSRSRKEEKIARTLSPARIHSDCGSVSAPIRGRAAIVAVGTARGCPGYRRGSARRHAARQDAR